jgi:Tfp pilus assembly protein PilN
MGEHGLGDQRLRRRVEQLRTVMVEQQRVSVAGLAGSRAEQIAYYRLLSNERVSEAALVEILAARARAAVTTLPGTTRWSGSIRKA